MNVLALAVALAGASLFALITFELGPQSASKTDIVLPTSQASAIGSRDPTQSNEAETAVRVTTLLTRPLFSQTRRAAVVASSALVTPSITASLPRMSGILIDGPRRLAIFAAQTGIPGSKPTAIAEGGLVGPFTIKTITPQQVTVIGPGGERTVHTSFDPDLKPPPTPTPTPVLYHLDAPKILNIPPGPSLLSRSLPSLQHGAPTSVFALPQATGAAR